MCMEVFEAIAQPKRREILRLLSSEELSAGQIASHFAVTQPAISQHLKVLKDARLVSERREGTKRMLSVRAEGLAELNDFLAEVMPANLERLKQAAEAQERAARDERRAKRN
jgi:DNA-binding transcriptional ArsR family regulator